MEAQHTLGAIRAAEIITGGKYDEINGRTYSTVNGNKTLRGIADVIDGETAAPEMLAALERMLALYEKMMDRIPHGDTAWTSEDFQEMNEAPKQAWNAIEATKSGHRPV